MIIVFEQRLILSVFALPLLICSCGGFGSVEQGIAIDYDASAGVVTLILDSNESGPPQYDVLPPIQVRVPENPRQMGPAPAAGKLLRVDPGAGTLLIFNARDQRFETISYQVVERTGNIYPDNPRVARGEVPSVDPSRGTITLYSPESREILTVSVPSQYLSLPADTWRFGDEVRYYFKSPGQALRMMNVSRTKVS